MIRTLALLLAVAILASVSPSVFVAHAATADEEELAELLAIVAEETAIATKQKMNSDFVPGIVTVLHGEELEALGMNTALEALVLVPGVQPVRDPISNPSIVVRGIDFPFNSGNVKILVDGVPLTRESAGLNGSVLLIPIEQVDRIEVIRGPGSVVYGDFAFMGLVNIVTRKASTSVFAGGDSDETILGGVRGAWGDGDAGWKGALSVAALDSDDTPFTEPRSATEEHYSSFVSMEHGGFALSGQLIRRNLDETSAPPPPGRPQSFEETTWALEGRYTHALSESLDVVARAARFATNLHPTLPAIQFEDDAMRVGVDVTWTGLPRQSWLASAEFARFEIDQASQTLLQGPPLVIADVDRDVIGVTLQDRIDLSDRFSVTAGARFDDYSDMDESRVTPRLSLVWRANDRHIVKAQYAEGFRAPTFFELYGGGSLNRDVDFEINATTELNYVYRRPNGVGRVTLYHSKLDDMVFPLPRSPRFGNQREAESQGIEVEWTQQLRESLKLIANASWARTEDDRGPTPVSHESLATPDWMGDIALLWQPARHAIVGLNWQHVAERDSTARGRRYEMVDLTLTGRDVVWSGVDVRVGVKNILDEDAAYVFTGPMGPLIAQYGGRSLFARIAWTR